MTHVYFDNVANSFPVFVVICDLFSSAASVSILILSSVRIILASARRVSGVMTGCSGISS